MSKHSELVLQNDGIRKKSDIRNKDKSELTWYQRTQRDAIDKHTKQLLNYQLHKSIFGTFDYRPDPLLLNQESQWGRRN